MKITYKLAQQFEVNPVNRNDIYIELNFNQEQIINENLPHLGIRNLFFAREDVKLFRDIRQAGIDMTGPGILEGVPFDTIIEHNNVIKTIRCYIDLADGFEFSKDGASVSIKLYESLDWFNSRIDGFTFETLFNENAFWQNRLRNKFVFVPYVISTIPDYQSAFTALLTIASLGRELYQAIEHIIKDIIDTLHWIDYLHLIMCILKLILQIIYAVVLIVSMINQTADFILFIIQPVKYQCGMFINDMLEIACERLGLSFSSTIFGKTGYMNKWAIIPEHYGYQEIPDQKIAALATLWSPLQTIMQRNSEPPTWTNLQGGVASVFDATGTTYSNSNGAESVIQFLSNPGLVGIIDLLQTDMGNDFNSKLKGFICPNPAQRGYINGTGGDIFRYAKGLCNGKIIIKNGTLYLERRDFVFTNITPYQLPDIRNDWVGYNTKEFKAVMVLKFSTDRNDKNVFDEYLGNIYETTQLPYIVNDPSLILTKDIRDIPFNLSRGINKTELSVPEKMVSLIIEQINKYSDVLLILYDVNAVLTDITDFVTTLGWNGLVIVIDTIVFALRGLLLVVNATLFGLAGLVFSVSLALNSITGPIQDIIDVLNGSPFNAGLPNVFVTHPIDNFTGILQVVVDPNSIPFLNIIDPTYESVPVLSIPGDYPDNDYTTRYNMLLLENDYIDVPKVVELDTIYHVECNPGANVAKLHPNNLLHVNAQAIFNYFYSIDLWIPNDDGTPSPTGLHNQYELFQPSLNSANELNKIRFGFDDFEKVVDDNRILDNDGNACLIDSLDWYLEGQWIDLRFRKNNIYTNNLKLVVSLPTGL